MPITRHQIDSTTGFLNRVGGLDAATRAVAEAESTHSGLAVLWLDIDRFRQINNSFGHAGGDYVITQVTQRIQQALGATCTLLRMGSDEFVALMPAVDREFACKTGNDLLVKIEHPLQIENLLMRPSVSIGIALHEPGEDPLHLLERADRAMLEAKRRGGNGLMISGDEPITGRLGVQLARAELAIEADLHTALESGGLSLHYQPVIGIDGRVEALEGLMRCDLPGYRLMPAKFIPVAEKTGLIVRMGEWSLLQGAQFAARLQNAGVATKVAINVSRAQLNSPSFVPTLQAALICANVEPALIELELTESLFLDLSVTVQANLRSAQAVGVGLSIDDFGIGYSSLSSLKDLPANKLKLDRSFIHVLPDDRRAYAVVKAMALLGRELGMTVVAEGVETIEQQAAVASAGVDAVQGYFHARPMPAEEMLAWLQKRKANEH